MIKPFISILIIFLFSSCWNGPAVHESYDFTTVSYIKIIPVNDHTYISGSGEMVETSLSHSFLKYGFNVNHLIIHLH